MERRAQVGLVPRAHEGVLFDLPHPRNGAATFGVGRLLERQRRRRRKLRRRPHRVAGKWAHRVAVVPKNLTDSSLGAELVLASSCLKGILGLRIQFRELALELTGDEHPPPTPVFMDANAVLLGIDSERK